MAAAKHSAEDFITKVRQLRADGASDELIATTIGVHGRKLYDRLARLGYKLADFPKGEGVKASRVRSANMSYDQLKADRKRTYHRKRVHENDLAQLTITLPGDGPYGIVFLGDPHVDDDGCDWGALDRHIGIIRDTDGLYAVNLGDTTNNWIGRLERLYAHQRTTSAEARILAAGFIQELAGKWLFHIGGNHDLWSGSDDPLPAICEAAKATYIPIGGKITVRQGRHLLHLNARHTFPGNSMWNPAHGAGRSVMMGNIEHITVCGHKHTTGHMVIQVDDLADADSHIGAHDQAAEVGNPVQQAFPHGLFQITRQVAHDPERLLEQRAGIPVDGKLVVQAHAEKPRVRGASAPCCY